MRGLYRVYDGETLVGEYPNIITNYGKEIIGKYMSGEVSTWAESMAFGTGTSSPSFTDTSLDLEFWRGDVYSKSYNTSSRKISLRCTIPSTVSGKIYEIGVYSASEGLNFAFSPVICTFDTTVQNWGQVASEAARSGVGQSSVLLQPPGYLVSAKSDLRGDFAAFNNDTIFSLGYEIVTGSISNIGIRLMSNDQNFREFSFSPPTGSHTNLYETKSWSLADFSITGNPAWQEISSIQITATGEGSVMFDVLAADKGEDEPTYVNASRLISRSLVGGEKGYISKEKTRELQVEYVVSLEE